MHHYRPRRCDRLQPLYRRTKLPNRRRDVREDLRPATAARFLVSRRYTVLGIATVPTVRERHPGAAAAAVDSSTSPNRKTFEFKYFHYFGADFCKRIFFFFFDILIFRIYYLTHVKNRNQNYEFGTVQLDFESAYVVRALRPRLTVDRV